MSRRYISIRGLYVALLCLLTVNSVAAEDIKENSENEQPDSKSLSKRDTNDIGLLGELDDDGIEKQNVLDNLSKLSGYKILYADANGESANESDEDFMPYEIDDDFTNEPREMKYEYLDKQLRAPIGFSAKRAPMGFMGQLGKRAPMGFMGQLGKRAPMGFMGQLGKRAPMGFIGQLGKRAPMGFMGQLGKRAPMGFMGQLGKRAPMGFMGQLGKRAPMGFIGQLGKRAPMGFMGQLGKRAPMGFMGQLGKRAPMGFMGQLGKRAPMGFMGQLGKRAPMGFMGQLGKRAPMGFVGQLGKRSSEDELLTKGYGHETAIWPNKFDKKWNEDSRENMDMANDQNREMYQRKKRSAYPDPRHWLYDERQMPIPSRFIRGLDRLSFSSRLGKRSGPLLMFYPQLGR